MEAASELAAFVQETGELLETLEQGLMALDAATDRDAINALFRAAHTIKGNSGIVGATHCAHFTHKIENVLARMRDGVLSADPEVVDLLLSAVDTLRTLVEAIGSGREDPPIVGADELVAALAELSATEAAAPAAAPDAERTFRIVLAIPSEETSEALRAHLAEIAQHGELLSIEPVLETPDAREFRFDLRTTLRAGDIEGIVIFSNVTIRIETLAVAAPQAPVVAPPLPSPEHVFEPAAAEAVPAAATATMGATPKLAPKKGPRAARGNAGTVKVDSQRLDALLDLVGEMSIALGAMRRAVVSPHGTQASRVEGLELLDRLGADVQERVMSLRMVPVRDTFERMRRPVRDAAQVLGKEVSFVTEGLETELDRKLLDELADPLTHMVRNAVAHGVEAPQAREAAGKLRTGKLVLRALHRNGAALIEVEDDGGGIDPAKVRRHAIARGLIAADATLTEQETYALLFAPGFSTAESVNQVAGRGVGLDVVVQSVERLHGRVEIVSTLGKGTTFRIRLPLTLAIVEGMQVQVGRETLSIPLRELEELLDPVATTIHTLEGAVEYVEVRGEMLPLVRMRSVLHVAGAADAGGSGGTTGAGGVVIVRSDRRRFAIHVDRVLGMARSVVKSLDRSIEVCSRASAEFHRSGALGGATILDDGTVGYVLDVHGVDGAAFDGVAA